MNINQIQNVKYDEFNALFEGVTDLPPDASPEQQIDIITSRLMTAKKMLGMTNKLTNPDERKKHRGRVMGFLNQLRPMLKNLISNLEQSE